MKKLENRKPVNELNYLGLQAADALVMIMI